MNKIIFLKKANIIFSMVAITLAIMIVGCQQEDFEMNSENPALQLKSNSKPLASDEFEYFGNIIKCRKGELKWQKQLSLILEDNDRLKENELVLEDVKYIDKIRSTHQLEDVLEQIFNDLSLCPVYKDNSNIFTLVPLKDISEKKRYREAIDSVFSYMQSDKKSNNQNDIFDLTKLNVVELTWKQQNVNFNTICLVSDKEGIIYDLLLSNIRFIEEFNYYTEKKSDVQTVPRLKSGAENTDGPVEYFFYNGVNLSGYLGSCLCYVACGAYGYNNNGIKTITSWNGPTQYSGASGTWSANASFNLIKNESQEKSFVWAWGYSTFYGNISISFGGFGAGFSVSGAKESKGALEEITPSKLY